MNFLNLPGKHRSQDSSYRVIPAPYEGNTTYGDGQSDAPKAVIEASHHLEYYDAQTHTEPYQAGILTTNPANDHESIHDRVSNVDFDEAFPVILGGDHSVTIPAVNALPSDVDVIIFDAHADMRYSWKGSNTNHACVTRRLSASRDITLLGSRSMDKAEYEAIQDSASVSLARPTDIPSHIVDNLGPKVHVSIDVDCFDPSIISQTGTSVPGGLTYQEVTRQLREIFDTHEVVSVDIVEFAPNVSEPSRRRVESFTLARLTYHVFGMFSTCSDSTRT